MLRVFVKSSLRRPPVPCESRRLCSGGSSQNASDQSKYSSSKEIGNPITWANPAGGASQDDRTSNAWKWVYPVGFGMIIFASLVSRYRNKDKEDLDEDESLENLSKKDRSVRMFQAMERLDFATKSKEDQTKVSRDYESDY